MARKPAPKEFELYRPLHDYLVENGYTVRSEVEDCDLVAKRGDELLVIELKRAFEMGLLIQAVDRQRITDSVYIAVPRASMRSWLKKWKGVRLLLRRLEIGLILVSPGSRIKPVEILLHPEALAKRKVPKRQRAILREMAGRSGDYNEGGMSRRKIVTAYRENAIQIAVYLRELGPSAPKALRKFESGPKTTPILYDNLYGWFEHVDRGTYGLSESGAKALANYPKLVERYENALATLRESVEKAQG